jgi:hypothetical protein
MKDYIKSWLPKIKNFSLELDKLSKLYNQPWVVIDDKNEFIKIIFQEKGKLIVSKNGVVSDGNWELVSVANSILLNIGGEKRLYNHQFIDNGLMILKLDGITLDFFILVNQNLIPDLDFPNYLTRKYTISKINDNVYKPINSYEKIIKLKDGRELQIIKDFGFSGSTEVKINDVTPEDGFYRLLTSEKIFEVKDGKIIMEYYIESFSQDNGEKIEISCSRLDGIRKGSLVWLNGRPAPDGVYKKGCFSKITVKNGKVN